jgi:hypothetical protein
MKAKKSKNDGLKDGLCRETFRDGKLSAVGKIAVSPRQAIP